MTRSTTPPAEFPIAGIGASAGGIQALHALFQAMPASTGCCFVVVQHLPPESPSQLVSLLRRWSELTVREIDDGQPITVDCIHVAPPGSSVMLDGEAFSTGPLGGSVVRPGIDTVDCFFDSLARSAGRRAIAVVLSGTGSDGAAGALKVKQAGGMVLVQDPATAGSEGMPAAAIASGAADRILSVPALAQELLAAALPAYVRGTAGDAGADDAMHALEGILKLIRAKAGVDLVGYKTSPLLWRIQHRMQLRQVAVFSEYEALLHDDPVEVDALVSSIPIHVTEFFRDPPSWEVLARDVIPRLFDEAGDRPIRAWTAGCATGEEAYSLAMLLAEQATALNRPLDFQVFATDSSADIVARASRGMFAPVALQAVSVQRRRRFFYSADGALRVRRVLRDRMVFAPQDVLADPPFPHIDLISCRNLLIYLEYAAARQVVNLLHASLRQGGVLFLGKSESLSARQGGFEEVSHRSHVYLKTGPAPRIGLKFPKRPGSQPRSRSSRGAVQAYGEKVALNSGDVPAVLVDPQFRILRLYGEAGDFLRLKAGEPNLNLLELMPPGQPLEWAARKAQAEDRAVTIDHVVNSGHGRRALRLRISPALAPDGAAARLLVTFDGRRGNGDSIRPEETRLSVADRSDDEVDWSEALRLSHQELDASREELQALNEELRASNEQLGIANDDLALSNARLLEKVAELETQSDILISGTVMALLLDADLRVRWFTPRVGALFPLQAGDVGRRIADLVPKFEDTTFLDEVREVMQTHVLREGEIRTREGGWYIKRIHPFRTVAGGGSGAAITFADITDRKRAEEALRDSEARLARDLAGMNRLHELNAAIANETNLLSALEAITAAACALVDTDRGCIQVVNADGERLEMVAHRGYAPDDPFMTHFLHAGSNPAWDAARRDRGRLVIEDVATFAPLQGTVDREVALASGIRATQSTPLTGRAGELLGVLSNQFRAPHRPTDDHLRLLDLLAWTAAAFIERHHAQVVLAEELASTRKLHEISTRLIDSGNHQDLYEHILDAAVAMMRSDFAILQVLHPDLGTGGELELVGTRNFTPEAAEFWAWVPHSSSSACGAAARAGRRVIVEDVLACDWMAGTADLATCVGAGIRSMQSTPLTSRTGTLQGMLSTHWREPHVPNEVELRRLDILARQAADLIERQRDETALRESERRQAYLLELGDALRALVDPVEIQAAATQLLGRSLQVERAFYAEADATGDRWLVTKGHEEGVEPLPDAPFAMATYGQWIIDDFRAGRALVVHDMNTDARFSASERAAQQALQIGAAVALPLVKAGTLLAMLVVHSSMPRDWTLREVAIVQETAERTWAAVERARAEAALRESEERLRQHAKRRRR